MILLLGIKYYFEIQYSSKTMNFKKFLNSNMNSMINTITNPHFIFHKSLTEVKLTINYLMRFVEMLPILYQINQ
jgi:hypothetical protein